MKSLCVDVETYTYSKGNPYDQRNKLVSIHCYDGTQSWSFKPSEKVVVQELIDKHDILIFFNAKFDIAWLRLYQFNVTNKKIYDVQLAEFYLSNQQHKLPSLDEVLVKYGLPVKVDKVAALWDAGVQTDAIPWDVLCEYGEGDVEKTYALYVLQLPKFSHKKKVLFDLACQDLLVLQEMEWNGLHYNQELCHEKSKNLQQDIQQLRDKLALSYPDVPINWGSPMQLSAFLYGGTIKEKYKELVGFYKTGVKAGQPKYKNSVREHQLPRLFTPLPKSEMAKPGIYATDEGTLRKLKGKHKKYVELLLELSALTKLDETYYQGLDKLNAEMHWPKNYLHGQFNQCIARTGRLSSSKPNLQNLSGTALDIFITRYREGTSGLCEVFQA